MVFVYKLGKTFHARMEPLFLQFCLHIQYEYEAFNDDTSVLNEIFHNGNKVVCVTLTSDTFPASLKSLETDLSLPSIVKLGFQTDVTYTLHQLIHGIYSNIFAQKQIFCKQTSFDNYRSREDTLYRVYYLYSGYNRTYNIIFNT